MEVPRRSDAIAVSLHPTLGPIQMIVLRALLIKDVMARQLRRQALAKG